MRTPLFLLTVLFLFTSCEGFLSHESGVDTKEAMTLNVTSEEIKSMQNIKADFEITNISGKKVTYGFPSSCQHGFNVKKGSETLFDSRTAYLCLAVVTSLELEPAESKVFNIDFRRGADMEPLEPGEYTLGAFLLSSDSDTVSTTFTVD